MPQSKRQTLWVIFAAPEQHGGRGNRFFAKNGTETKSRRNAAKFHSYEAARDFVNQKGIALKDPLQYIHQLDFDESELGD